MEHTSKDDGYSDPWERLKEEKKLRIQKNKKQQEINLRKNYSNDKNKSLSTIDLSTIPKKKHNKFNNLHKDISAKSLHHVDIALQIAQNSTNSMGKYDKKLKNEPRKKLSLSKKELNITHDPIEEKKHSLSIAKKILGKVTEDEALNIQHAIHAIKASDIKSGEIISSQKVLNTRKRKEIIKKLSKSGKRSTKSISKKRSGKKK